MSRTTDWVLDQEEAKTGDYRHEDCREPDFKDYAHQMMAEPEFKAEMKELERKMIKDIGVNGD